jgi:hypothetical protein
MEAEQQGLIAGTAPCGAPGGAAPNGSLGPWLDRRSGRGAALQRASARVCRGASLRSISAPRPPAPRKALLDVPAHGLRGEGRRLRAFEARRRRWSQVLP